MRIITFHLLNDFSGSPKVLRQVLQSLEQEPIERHVFTSKHTEGFLSAIQGVIYHTNRYRFYNFALLRLLTFFGSQFLLFFKLLFFLRKSDIVYINTVLPFSAAIAGKIKGCRVIYHLHETSISPSIFKWFLFTVIRFTASELVYVSQFLAAQEPLKLPQKVIYNSLDTSFITRAIQNRTTGLPAKNVLLICSLKRYKGVDVFVHLAATRPAYQFTLVLNASQEAIHDYFGEMNLPSNLKIYPTQKDTHPFYQKADVLLNLSDPNAWIETFGLTILEGMVYGLPSIVPPVGGVVELVENGVNGFQIECSATPLLLDALDRLFSDAVLYHSMQAEAIRKSQAFSPAIFKDSICQLVSKK